MGEVLQHLKGFSQVVESIYECAVNPGLWEAAMRRARAVLGAENAVLALIDSESHKILLTRDVGLEPGWALTQAPYIEEQNLFLERTLTRMHSLDEPVVMTRLMTPAEQAASPYLNEYTFPLGFADLMSMMLIHTPCRHARFDMGFRRNETQGAVTDEQLEMARLLLPHIRRAVMISDVLDIRTIERDRMSETLDLLRYGVIIVNADCRILHANASAESMLRANHLIGVSGGVLKAQRLRAAAEVESAVRLAAANETDLGKTGLAVVLTPHDAPPTVAHVLPLARGDFRTRLQPSAAAAIFIGRAADLEASAREIAQQFGLTPAERNVIAALLAGQTLNEAAGALGVSVNTARTHLASIFGKTGVSRQADLIRLAAQVEKVVSYS
jgi:DNA-binding CsgD family transcriptional regulator